MIINFSDIVKNKYPNEYNKYYNIGLKMLSEIIKTEYADNINNTFIDYVLNSNDIEILFYSLTDTFSIKNAYGILIYTTVKYNNEIKYYLLIFCIRNKYRRIGYGSQFLHLFIEYIKQNNKQHNKQINKRIILHSLETSVQFYKSIGFTEIQDKVYNYKKLFQYQKYNKNDILLNLEL
jgi:hypothetical protein